ncbi:MAG: DHA2 family efflux MFS transporter permease subunit [Sphingomonadales bacterium]|nr:DHA2 family efflux MFS transporter permease subunit [Sphingomonadales bacterium]
MHGKTYPDPLRRLLITGAAIVAVLMVTLDGTIAVIALPRIQSNLAASAEQIAWVLTSYLIAQAIATPLSGWLADRHGRVRIMALSTACFTIASLGCGLAPNLEVLVLFRFLQGLSGASLVPLTQVLLMDINPPEKQGPAIAAFGVGSLMGPMLGPILGGWLTEYVSWRAIFLVNVPVGVIATIGLLVFARDQSPGGRAAFDFKGFACVSIAIGAFQLMLDRGQLLDWWDSAEIIIEATLAATFLYVAVVHMATTAHPFIRPAIFRDRNFVLGTMLSAVVGVFLNGVIPIVTSLMQQLLGYPVMLTGLVSIPRAVGNMVTIMFVGRMVSLVDPRLLMATAMATLVASLTMLSAMSLDTSQFTLAWIGFLQGCGSGLLFLPLTMVVFSTLPGEYRNEASTLFALVRSLSGAAAISLIQSGTIRHTAVTRAHLVERLRPDNPVFHWRVPDFDVASLPGVGALAGAATRQAAMVAYVDAFRTILVMAVLSLPLTLLMRRTNPGKAHDLPVHTE